MSTDFNNIQLTKSQEESINYTGSDMLVKGVAGSGKSLVILKRAIKLKKEAEQKGESVIVFTFANTLVNYIDEIFEKTGCQVEVSTFDGYCYRLFRQMLGGQNLYMQGLPEQRKLVEQALQIHYDRRRTPNRLYSVDTDFWIEEFDWIRQKNIKTAAEYCSADRKGRGGKVRLKAAERKTVFLLYEIYEEEKSIKNRYDWGDMYAYIIDHKKQIPDRYKRDYILVDEAQDLSYAKLKTAKLLAKKNITIAADQAQKIYNTSFSWVEIGIDIRGRRTKTLEKPFRSTKQIVELASTLQKINQEQSNNSEYTDIVIPEREGSIPKMFGCNNKSKEYQVIMQLIRAHLDTNESIGVLFRTKIDRNRFEATLVSNEIGCEVVEKGKSWSVNTPGVKLVTLHSAKGLEFDNVIIPFLNKDNIPYLVGADASIDEPGDDEIIKQRSLVYVGMTRAKQELYLTFTGEPSMFLREMDPGLYEMYDEDGKITEKLKQIVYDDPSVESNSEYVELLTDENVKVGMHIKHFSFGKGVITRVERARIGGTLMIEADFVRCGAKSFGLGYGEIFIRK